MPEIHLRQPGFAYSAYRSFTKYKERMQKLKETGDSQYIYQNELDKAWFRHDKAYGHINDLPRMNASDRVLPNKTFNANKNPKYDGYQRGLASMVYKWLIKSPLPVVMLEKKKCQTKNYLKNYKNQLLENLKSEKYTHLLQTRFGVLILPIYN